jgi:DNA-binding NarL/FixJ family response regulator
MANRVLIVDDHERFRATARRALEVDGWTVVGEAADGASALDAADRIDADVVLLDIGLPDMSGLEVAAALRERSPSLAVVLVSTHDEGDYGQLAAETGARGFIAKADLSGDALDALLAPAP